MNKVPSASSPPEATKPQSFLDDSAQHLSELDECLLDFICKFWRNQASSQQNVVAPVLSKDNQHRQKAESHLVQARLLKNPKFDKALQVQDSEQIERSREEFRKAIVEILAIDPKNRTVEDLKMIYTAAGEIAGRRNAKPPCCLLCLKDKKLIDSHIIPQSVLVRLINEVLPDGQIGANESCLVVTNEPNRDYSAQKATLPLFCKPGCEDLFSDHGENNFAEPFWNFIALAKDARNQTPMRSVKFESAPGDNSVHYCVASIIFRHMIINGSKDTKIFQTTGGPEILDSYWRLFFLLRNYMLDPENEPAPYIGLFASEKDVGAKTMVYTLFTTSKNEQNPRYITGHFELAGFHFIVMESAQVRQQNSASFDLPSKGFCSEIKRCQAPDKLVIEIKPDQILTLPKVADLAREFDAMIWQKLVMSRSLMSEVINGRKVAKVPAHPLLDSYMKNFPPQKRSQLPDELKIIVDPVDGSPNLSFRDASQYEMLTHVPSFTKEQSRYDVWLCKHKRSKKDPYIAVLHVKIGNVSTSFGYHLADGLFEKDVTGEAQTLLDSKNKDEFVELLGLKPLRSTQHELIEETTKATSSYQAILNALLEFWSLGSAERQTSRHFVVHSDGNEIRFQEKILPKDADFLLHMFGISRKAAILLLQENHENECIRSQVADVIVHKFRMDELPPSLQIESVLKEQKIYLERAPKTGLSIVGAEKISNRELTRQLKFHEENCRKQEKCLERVRTWAGNKGVYKNFVKGVLGGESDLTSLLREGVLLNLIAKLRKVYVAIWIQDSEDPKTLNYYDSIGNTADGKEGRINVILDKQCTYLNLLLE